MSVTLIRNPEMIAVSTSTLMELINTRGAFMVGVFTGVGLAAAAIILAPIIKGFLSRS